VFNITLHLDDKGVLEFISNKLKVGKVRLRVQGEEYQAEFTVFNKENLYNLFSIFDKYNFNTTKYFDYLDFRKAFILYHERAKNLSKEDKDRLIGQIIELKNGMNTQRTDINMASLLDKITITKSWLLGFIEGYGSFFISRTDIEPSFSIELSNVQLFLLEKIKEFLIDDFGLDKYSVYKLKNTSVISIQSIKSKASTLLIIKKISLLNNYLIPYFRVMKFYSKKAKDFKDFQLICEAVYKGSHKTEEVKALILRLSYTMNSYRLSTNKIKEQLLSQKELDIIQNALAYLIMA
jgi:hypothetical protein